MNPLNYLIPDWTLPSHVHTAMTLRTGGVSLEAYQSLNLATHVDDELTAVVANRQRIKAMLCLPSEPIWLEQTHSTQVIQADNTQPPVIADASFTTKSKIVCAVLTADCLPLLFCTQNGETIAAVHVGWRGLLAGIIGQTLTAMQTQNVSVWLGAAIGNCCFEVGAEVRELFINQHPPFIEAFTPLSTEKYCADIYQLARIDLNLNGIHDIYGGDLCTVCDPHRFYSYRRNQQTGRMATLIWKN